MLDYYPIISYIVFMAPEVRAVIITASGQLQVVARHTDTSPSSCYGPVLIPEPCANTSGFRGTRCQ